VNCEAKETIKVVHAFFNVPNSIFTIYLVDYVCWTEQSAVEELEFVRIEPHFADFTVKTASMETSLRRKFVLALFELAHKVSTDATVRRRLQTEQKYWYTRIKEGERGGR